MKRIIFLVLFCLLFFNVSVVTAQQSSVLYGITTNGGTSSAGNIFSIDTVGNNFASLFIFKKDTNGYNPYGSLTQDTDGVLYGMTNNQSTQYGTIFSYNILTNTFSLLHQFLKTDGAFPDGSLTVGPGGVLYGMTPSGGTNAVGVLFSINPVSKQYSKLFDFSSSFGINPTGNLLYAKNGLLYGMTSNGSSDYGTLFSYNIATQQTTALFGFNLTNGAYPKGSLVLVSDSMLYGLTSQGGNADSGTLFSYNIASNTPAVLVNFVSSTGVFPKGSLLQANDGKLYGMTSGGGVFNKGVIFCYNISENKDSVVFTFNGINGAKPHGSLIQANNGLLYGMTDSGGVYNEGMAFRFNLQTGVEDTLMSFTGLNGANPGGDFLEPMTATISKKNNKCYGDSIGSAIINVKGGHYPLAYLWSNGATTDTITGLKAGSYIAKVIDQQNISYSFNFIITQPAQVRDSIAQEMNVLCFGGSNGSAAVGVEGGVKPYTYLWSSSAGTGFNASNLIAGSYTCTITDSNKCMSQVSVAITQPAVLKDSADSVTNVTCYGHNTGAAVINVIGGIKPYTYNWTAGAGHSSSVNSLIAATYTCTITDFNSCVISDVVTINTSSKIITETSVTPTPCTQSHGTVQDSVLSGGAPPYTYLWSANNVTNMKDTALTSGSYICTITDTLMCSISDTVYLPNTGGPKDSIVKYMNDKCYGGTTGIAIATSTGGKLPYTYTWYPSGGNDTVALNLKAGTYTFTTKDSTGCIGIATVTIAQPTEIIDSVTQKNNVNCFGGNNGSVLVGVTGGTPPYMYSWSAGSASNASDSLLAAGSYTCNISDNNNCAALSVGFSITSPAPLELDTAATVTQCGKNRGTATVIASGGTPPYSYAWNSSQTTSSISNVAGGLYLCNVTDSLHCINKVTFVVPDTGGPKALIVSQINEECYGYNSGGITATAKGKAPFTYSWLPGGQTTPSIMGLSAGTYTCIVTDSTTCIGTATVSITQPASIQAKISTIGVCSGNINGGYASISVSNGIPPYSLSWSNDSTTDSITNLTPGAYFCRVTDSNGCYIYATCNITQAPPVVINSLVAQTTSCYGCSNGAVVVSVVGGIPAGDSAYYFYVWSNGATGDSIINGLDSGAYSVCITSPYGCGSVCDSITVVTGINSQQNQLSSVRVYPVPTNGPIYIDLPESGLFTISITNAMGEVVYIKKTGANDNVLKMNLGDMPDGVYFMQILSDKGFAVKKIIIEK